MSSLDVLLNRLIDARIRSCSEYSSSDDDNDNGKDNENYNGDDGSRKIVLAQAG